ncbi:MAG: hypothetical protein KC589_09705 [Nanoarchaeota archaeon]|nr:hypothetical protein [Nanoarchaeota archaeon]
MSLLEKLDNSTINFYSKIQDYFQEKFGLARTQITDYAFILASSGYLTAASQANSPLDFIFPLMGAGVSAGFIVNERMRFFRGISLFDGDLTRDFRLLYHSLAIYKFGHVLKLGIMEANSDYFFDKPLETYLSVEMLPFTLGTLGLGTGLYFAASESNGGNLGK